MQKVIYKQEESIKDLETNLKEYKNKIEHKSSEVSITQDKLHAKDIEITAIKDKLADADKLLENNKQMIAWLNTQVSEHKFNKFKPPTSVPNFNMNNNYSNAQSFQSTHSNPINNGYTPPFNMNATNNISNINKNSNSFSYQSPFKPMSRQQSPSKYENNSVNMLSANNSHLNTVQSLNLNHN